MSAYTRLQAPGSRLQSEPRTQYPRASEHTECYVLTLEEGNGNVKIRHCILHTQTVCPLMTRSKTTTVICSVWHRCTCKRKAKVRERSATYGLSIASAPQCPWYKEENALIINISIVILYWIHCGELCGEFYEALHSHYLNINCFSTCIKNILLYTSYIQGMLIKCYC